MFQNLLWGYISDLNRTFLKKNECLLIRKFALATSSFSSNKNSHYPPLDESEIVETFSNGSGPGGQKTNKTHNRCQLKHKLTGLCEFIITVNIHRPFIWIFTVKLFIYDFFL